MLNILWGSVLILNDFDCLFLVFSVGNVTRPDSAIFSCIVYWHHDLSIRLLTIPSATSCMLPCHYIYNITRNAVWIRILSETAATYCMTSINHNKFEGQAVSG